MVDGRRDDPKGEPLLLSRRALLLTTLLWTPAGLAQDAAVPPTLQATLFKKIFAYDPALQAPGGVRVVVVYTGASTAVVSQVVAAFSELGIPATAVDVRDAETALASATVLYLAEGNGMQAVLAKAAARKLLSISGIASLAERGEVAVGLGKSSSGRPEIVVHRGRLKREGHELSANLLRLARVIQ
jgi:YfiR/HmsC-like